MTDTFPKLKPLVAKCPCGSRATKSRSAVFLIGGYMAPASIPVCDEHGTANIVRLRTDPLPTHEPIEVHRAAKFPPSIGEILASPLMVGCPKCAGLFSLEPRGFTLNEVGLCPSFVCPDCALHAWLIWEKDV